MKLLGGDPRFDELMRRLRDTGIGKSVSASEWMEVEEFLHDIMTPSEDLSSLAIDCCQTVHDSTTNAQAVEVIALKINQFIARHASDSARPCGCECPFHNPAHASEREAVRMIHRNGDLRWEVNGKEGDFIASVEPENASKICKAFHDKILSQRPTPATVSEPKLVGFAGEEFGGSDTTQSSGQDEQSLVEKPSSGGHGTSPSKSSKPDSDSVGKVDLGGIIRKRLERLAVDPMKCDSGKHEWINPICRDRCCKPEWKRVLALNGKHQHLEKDGRVYTEDGAFVHGWIKVKSQTDMTTQPEML